MHKQLGKYSITIINTTIVISDDRNMNQGIIYKHNLEALRRGEDVRIMGFDNNFGLTKAVKKYIFMELKK